VKLVPIDADDDIGILAEMLAPGFGGDPEAAKPLLEQTLDLLTRDPRPAPWGAYLAHESQAVVGTCAFKSAPNARGEVELAYMTFPAFEGRGHATAMAAELIRIASAEGVARVIAHTLPQENGSTRALRRNGFAHSGEVMDPEDGLVWRWELANDAPR
jgi:RimJ/RimL family protein N-acetyltransferase